VPLHGVIAQPQPFRDRRITHPISDQREHFAFARAQGVEAGRLAGARHWFEVLFSHYRKQAQSAFDPLDWHVAALVEAQSGTGHQIGDDTGDQHVAGRRARDDLFGNVGGKTHDGIAMNFDFTSVDGGSEPDPKAVGKIAERDRAAHRAGGPIETRDKLFYPGSAGLAAIARDNIARGVT